MAASLSNGNRRLDALDCLSTEQQASMENQGGQNYLLSSEENKASLERVFLGLKVCLQVTDDTEEVVLMKTNQILYDLMPDILRFPEIQTEV